MISELTNDDFYLIQINVFLFVYLKKIGFFSLKLFMFKIEQTY